MFKNNENLSKIFTSNGLTSFLNNNSINIDYTDLESYKHMKNKDLIMFMYSYMSKNYRNEYFYKNTLLNKILLGKYSLNSSTALKEVQINQSKADFILINGKAVVYEIKTELDNFDRLLGQLKDYYKAFNYVSVITCESNYEKLNKLLDSTKVGISILTARNTISIRKKPIEENLFLEHESIFKILRKKEFENILIKKYKKLPVTTQVNYYKECLNWFSEIPIEYIYRNFLIELKKRSKVNIDLYSKYVPYELRTLVYFSEFKDSDYLKLNEFLEKKFGG